MSVSPALDRLSQTQQELDVDAQTPEMTPLQDSEPLDAGTTLPPVSPDGPHSRSSLKRDRESASDLEGLCEAQVDDDGNDEAEPVREDLNPKDNLAPVPVAAAAAASEEDPSQSPTAIATTEEKQEEVATVDADVDKPEADAVEDAAAVVSPTEAEAEGDKDKEAPAPAAGESQCDSQRSADAATPPPPQSLKAATTTEMPCIEGSVTQEL